MVKLEKKTQKSRLPGYLELSEEHEILDPDFNSCTEPEKMLDSRLKGWKFAFFWVEMHEFCGFLSCVVFLWAKNLLGVEFRIPLSTIDNKVRAFVSISIGYSYE